MSLAQRVEGVRHRIEQACRRCGRSPSSVTLVAVTKTIPVDTMTEAIGLGLIELGENRVQEALAKQDALGSRVKVQGKQIGLEPSTFNLEPAVRWHLIGHLQRNKAKHAVQLFDVIHSVDSLTLVEELERHAGNQDEDRGVHRVPFTAHPIEVFIQVNVSEESTKSGCRAEDAEPIARAVMASRHLAFRGLMTMAPLAQQPESARPVFQRLRELRDALARQLPITGDRLQLSMGMSHDFEIAIEEGADVVRIGTAIFGAQRG